MSDRYLEAAEAIVKECRGIGREIDPITTEEVLDILREKLGDEKPKQDREKWIEETAAMIKEGLLEPITIITDRLPMLESEQITTLEAENAKLKAENDDLRRHEGVIEYLDNLRKFEEASREAMKNDKTKIM
jgi:hypothetical protein